MYAQHCPRIYGQLWWWVFWCPRLVSYSSNGVLNAAFLSAFLSLSLSVFLLPFLFQSQFHFLNCITFGFCCRSLRWTKHTVKCVGVRIWFPKDNESSKGLFISLWIIWIMQFTKLIIATGIKLREKSCHHRALHAKCRRNELALSTCQAQRRCIYIDLCDSHVLSGAEKLDNWTFSQ